MCPAQRWAMPEASKAYASWRAPGTGSPTSTSRPAVSASTCTLNPHSWCLSENMFASAPGRSPVGATNPSTSSGALAAAAWTCATRLALTAPSSGYSIVNSREMLDWEQPNSSPATSWELLWRNRNSVSTTARYRPMTLGRPTGRCHTPTRAATAVTRSVTCSWARPVIRSHRGGRPSVISLVHTTQVIYRRTAAVTRSDTPRFDHSGQSGVLNNAPVLGDLSAYDAEDLGGADLQVLACSFDSVGGQVCLDGALHVGEYHHPVAVDDWVTGEVGQVGYRRDDAGEPALEPVAAGLVW